MIEAGTWQRGLTVQEATPQPLKLQDWQEATSASAFSPSTPPPQQQTHDITDPPLNLS